MFSPEKPRENVSPGPAVALDASVAELRIYTHIFIYRNAVDKKWTAKK